MRTKPTMVGSLLSFVPHSWRPWEDWSAVSRPGWSGCSLTGLHFGIDICCVAIVGFVGMKPVQALQF